MAGKLQFFLIQGNKSDFSVFLKKEKQNSLLNNPNDSGDNNEKRKCLKAWVGIFWVRIVRGEFSREEFGGWDFSRGEFS